MLQLSSPNSWTVFNSAVTVERSTDDANHTARKASSTSGVWTTLGTITEGGETCGRGYAPLATGWDSPPGLELVRWTVLGVDRNALLALRANATSLVRYRLTFTDPDTDAPHTVYLHDYLPADWESQPVVYLKCLEAGQSEE